MYILDCLLTQIENKKLKNKIGIECLIETALCRIFATSSDRLEALHFEDP